MVELDQQTTRQLRTDHLQYAVSVRDKVRSVVRLR